jgi:bifunctional UDP-N-acetylglucosamine pyrophosphorylase/glucosamine-1-phosphate N-acetyltransferase
MTVENTNAGEHAREIAVVILAAGKGTRMRSVLPKVLHPIAGAPMLHHAMRAGLSLNPARLAVVVGPDAEAVATAVHELAPGAAICEQAKQLGTGHAVRMAESALAGFTGDVFVLYGDTPFISAETLAAMTTARADGADLVALGFDAAEPGGYGRMVTGSGDTLERIVEAKDASAMELAIRTCNSGVMAADSTALFGLLAQIVNDNAKGEYYLTDVIGLARARGLNARVVRCGESETLGINDRAQLAEAEAAFQARARHAAMLGGATLTAPETVFLAWDTRLGRDVTIAPNVVFGPGVAASAPEPSSAPSPGCVREPTSARTRASAISSRSRMRVSARAPRSTTSAMSATPRWARGPIWALARSPATMTASPSI